MKRIILFVFWPAMAMAQQQPPTLHEQALGGQIMQCVTDTIGVREQLAAMQQQLAAAQAEIAKLKEPPK